MAIVVSAVGVAALLGAPGALERSMGPKSATTPIAMAVSQQLDGISSLAARGFALGLASHGIGTARAFQVSPEMDAFAGPGMGLTGVMTALLAPWLVPLLPRATFGQPDSPVL